MKCASTHWPFRPHRPASSLIGCSSLLLAIALFGLTVIVVGGLV